MKLHLPQFLAAMEKPPKPEQNVDPKDNNKNDNDAEFLTEEKSYFGNKALESESGYTEHKKDTFTLYLQKIQLLNTIKNMAFTPFRRLYWTDHVT